MQAPENQHPLFVLCCARSGSTLLRYIIDTHPDVCCPPELHLATLIRQLTWVYGNTSHLKKEGATSDEILRSATASARKNISTIMEEYATRNGKQIWCEKSVYTVDFLDIVNTTFPEARYICLYRNCMDFVHSALETTLTDPGGQSYGFAPFFARHPGNKIEALIDYWVTQTGKALHFEQRHKTRCYRVRYEDIVQTPDITLPALFRFLGLDWNQELTRAIFNTHHDIGPGDNKIRTMDKIQASNVGKGKEIAAHGLSEKLLSAMQQLQRILNYN